MEGLCQYMHATCVDSEIAKEFLKKRSRSHSQKRPSVLLSSQLGTKRGIVAAYDEGETGLVCGR